MSTYGITVDTANVGNNYVDKDFPYASSFAGIYLFGDNETLSCLNRAPGATVNLTPNGTPTYGDGYVEMDYPTDYFGTGINLSGGQSIIVVATQSVGGEYYASAAPGVLLGMGGPNSTVARFSSGFGPTCVGTAVSGASYQFIAGATAGTTGQPFNLYVGKADSLTTTTNGSLGANLPSAQVTIGPSGHFSSGVGHRQVLAAISDSELTEAQLLEIYRYLRFKLPKRGIMVA